MNFVFFVEDAKRLNEKLTEANKIKVELKLKLHDMESSAASVQVNVRILRKHHSSVGKLMVELPEQAVDHEQQMSLILCVVASREAHGAGERVNGEENRVVNCRAEDQNRRTAEHQQREGQRDTGAAGQSEEQH